MTLLWVVKSGVPQLLWGSPLLRMRFSLVAALFCGGCGATDAVKRMLLVGEDSCEQVLAVVTAEGEAEPSYVSAEAGCVVGAGSQGNSS